MCVLSVRGCHHFCCCAKCGTLCIPSLLGGACPSLEFRLLSVSILIDLKIKVVQLQRSNRRLGGTTVVAKAAAASGKVSGLPGDIFRQAKTKPKNSLSERGRIYLLGLVCPREKNSELQNCAICSELLVANDLCGISWKTGCVN